MRPINNLEINWAQGKLFIAEEDISQIVQIGKCVQLVMKNGKMYHLADYDSRETALLAYNKLRARVCPMWFGVIDMLDIDKLRNLPG